MKHILNVFLIIGLLVIVLIGTGLFLFVKINRSNQQDFSLLLSNNKKNTSASVNDWFKNIDSIPVPNGFKRIASPSNNFAFYLQHLPLKKDKTVYLFNGQEKRNQQAQICGN